MAMFAGVSVANHIVCGEGLRYDSSGSYCVPCDCSLHGTAQCVPASGECVCNRHNAGRHCHTCDDGYFKPAGNHSNCVQCTCSSATASTGACDATTGACTCRHGYRGDRCEACALGFRRHGDECRPCGCDGIGAGATDECHPATGQCTCRRGYLGTSCDQCATGYHRPVGTPQCVACNCSQSGSLSAWCHSTGVCLCRPGTVGSKCNACASPASQFLSAHGCQDLSQSLIVAAGETFGEQTVQFPGGVAFGSRSQRYDSLEIRRNGFMTFTSQDGRRVRPNLPESSAVIAPFWLDADDISSSSALGTISVATVNSSAQPDILKSIVHMVLNSSRPPIGDFHPVQALVVTWKDIPAAQQPSKKNTFQAVLVSDDCPRHSLFCQSYAVFLYPEDGITYTETHGHAAIFGSTASPGQPLSTVNAATVSSNASTVVFKLTPDGEHARNVMACDGLEAVPESHHSAVRLFCPLTASAVAVFPVFVAYTRANVSARCFRSRTALSGPAQNTTTICCYGSTGQLIEHGEALAYVTYRHDDEKILQSCAAAGHLEHFFSSRRSPLVTDKFESIGHGYLFGDPHVRSFAGKRFEFHSPGEYRLFTVNTHTVSGAFIMDIFCRFQELPSNTLGYTSASAVAIVVGPVNQTVTIHVSAMSGKLQVLLQNGMDITSNIASQKHDYIAFDGAALVVNGVTAAVKVEVQSGSLLTVSVLAQHSPSQMISPGLLSIDTLKPKTQLDVLSEVLDAAETYRVSADNSPFRYASGESHSLFNPARRNPLPLAASNVAKLANSDARLACGGSVECLVDAVVAGSTAAGLATKRTRDALSAVDNALYPVPVIMFRPPVLDARINHVSNLSVLATSLAPGAHIVSVALLNNASAVLVASGNVTVKVTASSTLLFSWTPRVYTENVTFAFRATDSNGRWLDRTLTVRLCGCHDSCAAILNATSVAMEPMMLLPCVACPPGRTGRYCQDDLDSCLSNPCGRHQTCIDTKLPGDGYRCGPCEAGFTLTSGSSTTTAAATGAAGTCANVNECAEDHSVAVCGGGAAAGSNASHMCVDTYGSYRCDCAPGYSAVPAGASVAGGLPVCHDIDECRAGVLTPVSLGMATAALPVAVCDAQHSVCRNTAGSYECDCATGYNGTGAAQTGGCLREYCHCTDCPLVDNLAGASGVVLVVWW
ncbi:mucin-like protein [Sycon ciliatum]|uniref:mucin-like protein n=1 Tax=Sycon ciliatum TaxID=27933 RepID=UPI0031F71002